MSIAISSDLEADYLLIRISGSVAGIDEMKSTTRQVFDEITKYDAKKILIDQMEYQPPESLLYQTELVDFYSEEFPVDARQLKVAIATERKNKKIAGFWETCANNRGYYFNVFYSIDDAREFMKG